MSAFAREAKPTMVLFTFTIVQTLASLIYSQDVSSVILIILSDLVISALSRQRLFDRVYIHAS